MNRNPWTFVPSHRVSMLRTLAPNHCLNLCGPSSAVRPLALVLYV